MLFDSPNKILKSESLNEFQKGVIKSQLDNSRYSKLVYNKIEISSKKIEYSCFSKQKTISDNQKSDKERKNIELVKPVEIHSFSPVNSLITDDEYEEDEPTFEVIITEKNKNQEIEEIISRIITTNLPLSPSKYYLNLQNLNSEESKLISSISKETVEIFKQKKDRVTKERKLRKENDSEFTKNLDKLRQQVKTVKDSVANKSSVSIIHSTEKLKELLNKSDFKKSPPKLSIESAEESDLNSIKELEKRLNELLSQFKIIRQRCETDENRNLFDQNFNETLRSSILCIEKINGEFLPSKLTQIKIQNRINDLSIIESKYSQILKDIEHKADVKLEQYAKQKEKIEQETLSRKLLKEKQEKDFKKQKQTKYIEDLEKSNTKFQEIIKFLSYLAEEDLKTKISIIQKLSNTELLAEAKNYQEIIEKKVDEVKKFVKTNIEGSKQLLASDFSENELTDFFKDIKDNLLNCIKNSQDFESLLKKLNHSIETALNLKITKERELKNAEEAKEIAEQNEKLAAEAKKDEEEKQREQQKKYLEMAKIKQSQDKIDAKNRVKSIQEADINGINSLTYTEYEKRRFYFNKLQYEIEEVFKDSSLKMYKFDLQKAVNFPLNSMLEDNSSEDNRRNFNEKIKTLLRLLNGHTCTITSTLTVNPTRHPRAIEFCLMYLARKLVEKGEETVGSRPETAFQYSQLLIDILKQVPYFEDIILGQFQEKCPFVVPYYKPRDPKQTDDEYLTSLGYKTISGKIEDEVHYTKRMSGVLHLYFTFLISVNSSMNCKIGLKTAWQWLSDVLNLTPRPNVTAEILNIFFKCCGSKLQQNYGKQFNKLMNICTSDFYDMIKSIPNNKQTGASVGRLESTLESFKKTNRFFEWKNINK